jgi:hypothetical protein
VVLLFIQQLSTLAGMDRAQAPADLPQQPQQQAGLVCAACTTAKPADAYTKIQRGKNEGRRCKQCLGNDKPKQPRVQTAQQKALVANLLTKQAAPKRKRIEKGEFLKLKKSGLIGRAMFDRGGDTIMVEHECRETEEPKTFSSNSTWVISDTEPAEDPRGPGAKFMDLCHRTAACVNPVDIRDGLSAIRQLWEEMGSPSLRGVKLELSDSDAVYAWADPDAVYAPGPACSGTPLRAVYEACDQGGDAVEPGVAGIVAFLQDEAGCVAEQADFLFSNHLGVLESFGQQGMVLDGVDVTDITTDGGMGGPDSATEALFTLEYYGDVHGSPDQAVPQEVEDMLMSLLRSGADVWPFHVPGVTASRPPPDEEYTSADRGHSEPGTKPGHVNRQDRKRRTIGGILWPGKVPEQKVAEGDWLEPDPDPACFFSSGALAPLVDAACGFCAERAEARRKQANWERRRVVLMCTTMGMGPVPCAAKQKQQPPPTGADAAAATLRDLHSKHEALLRRVVAFL